ncbi:hypothetical protein BDN70DRAFT_874368 [Pholiota conissans]|uniref:Uncharacterized protein n=1 Tax=Pholiota conissans TaxID=109636 RepID=A0A9P5ZAJ6_9AGAR|nr:hypothetical protein BDN70DRAFT_874368 [Pholiota conissans]
MPRLPLDIVETVIDILTQEDDSNFSFIKSCALVCHDFLPISRKRIFASLAINDSYACPSQPYAYIHRMTPSRFRELLTTSPEIADYIRDLNYRVREKDLGEDALIASLKSMTRLQSLMIWNAVTVPISWNWSTSRIRTAFVHLFRLPTFNELSLYGIRYFIIADLPPNLKNFTFDDLHVLPAPPPSSQINIYAMSIGRCGYTCDTASEQFYEARIENGKPVIDLTSLNSLESELYGQDSVKTLQDLLGHCTGLAHVKIQSIGSPLKLGSSADSILTPVIDESLSLAGLNRVHKMLSPSLKTLKHLQIKAVFNYDDPYCGIADELELMSGRNVIEIINIQITIRMDAEGTDEDEWGRLDSIRTQPAWPHLRSLILSIIVNSHAREDELAESLKAMAATQFKGITSRETVSFKFNVSEDWL